MSGHINTNNIVIKHLNETWKFPYEEKDGRMTRIEDGIDVPDDVLTERTRLEMYWNGDKGKEHPLYKTYVSNSNATDGLIISYPSTYVLPQDVDNLNLIRVIKSPKFHHIRNNFIVSSNKYGVQYLYIDPNCSEILEWYINLFHKYIPETFHIVTIDEISKVYSHMLDYSDVQGCKTAAEFARALIPWEAIAVAHMMQMWENVRDTLECISHHYDTNTKIKTELIELPPHRLWLIDFGESTLGGWQVSPTSSYYSRYWSIYNKGCYILNRKAPHVFSHQSTEQMINAMRDFELTYSL